MGWGKVTKYVLENVEDQKRLPDGGYLFRTDIEVRINKSGAFFEKVRHIEYNIDISDGYLNVHHTQKRETLFEIDLEDLYNKGQNDIAIIIELLATASECFRGIEFLMAWGHKNIKPIEGLNFSFIEEK